jgi:hypothetical protein
MHHDQVDDYQDDDNRLPSGLRGNVIPAAAGSGHGRGKRPSTIITAMLNAISGIDRMTGLSGEKRQATLMIKAIDASMCGSFSLMAAF